SGYVPNEMVRDLTLDLNKNSFIAASTLNHKFYTQNILQTGYLKSDPPAFQKDLFIKDISLRSGEFRRALIAPALFTVAGLSTLLDDDNDDDYEVQAERNRYLPHFRHRADD